MWKPEPPPFGTYKKDVFERASKVTDFIYQIGEHPGLRQPSKAVPIKDITAMEYQQKIRYMHDCLRRYRRLTGYGRGITGIQVGIPERISVLFTTDMEIMTVINPKILSKSYKQYKYPEICMSANPIIAPVVRPAWIEISYYDEEGKKKNWKTKDETPADRIMNRVLQHELDHMEGIINIDKVGSPSELIIESDPEFYDKAGFEEV